MSRRNSAILGLIFVCNVAWSAQPRHNSPDAPLLEASITPVVNSALHAIDAVDVKIRISGLNVPSGAPLLRMPLVIYNVETVAKTLERLFVADPRGPLKLSVRDDPEGGRELNRQWVADRSVAGTLTVHYRAPISNRLAPLGGAPPVELRSERESFSGGGIAFLTLPVTKINYRVAVHWDLSALASDDTVALSSLGGGNVSSSEPLSLDQLSHTFFMAGRVGSFPRRPPQTGFFAAWQGTPPFDTPALMQWTATLHNHYAVLFKEKTPAPYGVFLRPNLVNPGGGIGQEHSFIATFDDKTPANDLKFTLAHEMLHTYIGGLGGDEQLDDAWFSEGLAVYYQRTLPLRFGQMSVTDFLVDLNKTAGRYYTDALASTPNSQIGAQFWSETRVRVLPYDRGALYFATVNDAVRKASHGKRSLDDLVLAMLQRRQEKGDIVRADWEEVITRELGQPGLSDFQAMLEGKQVLPTSDAFGACFRRTTRQLRRYELGFDPKVTAERHRVVRGLIADSAAARAGLRNSDEILKPFGQDKVQEDQTQTLTLEVRHDGKVSSLTYLPRGEAVQAYQWERVPTIPENECGI